MPTPTPTRDTSSSPATTININHIHNIVSVGYFTDIFTYKT